MNKLAIVILGFAAAVCGCSTLSRQELITEAYEGKTMESRVIALETLNKRNEPGFDYWEMLNNPRVEIPVRVMLVERHGNELSSDQLMCLAGIEHMHEVRCAALAYIDDRQFLSRIVGNRSFDTLADAAQKRLNELK